MLLTVPPQQVKSPQFPFGEQRVVFPHLTWEGYLAILAAIGDNRSARLTYDTGKLELTTPLEEHEFSEEMIALFTRIFVEELGMEVKSMSRKTMPN